MIPFAREGVRARGEHHVKMLCSIALHGKQFSNDTGMPQGK
jgi:hypothetical protein